MPLKSLISPRPVPVTGRRVQGQAAGAGTLLVLLLLTAGLFGAALRATAPPVVWERLSDSFAVASRADYVSNPEGRIARQRPIVPAGTPAP